jgi:DNA-binding SARP family transcriptional activator
VGVSGSRFTVSERTPQRPLRYAILGPIELRAGERGSSLAGPREVALLAALLVNADSALSSDQLIDAVWGGMAPQGALKRLQVAIARLRRKLDGDGDGTRDGSVLRTVPGGYLLAVAPGELDADVFESLVEEGRHAMHRGATRHARDLLAEALALWRGPALANVAYKDFAQLAIRRLTELRLAALETRIDVDLELGNHGALIAELEEVCAEHPQRERLAGQLMVALYRCGRQADALDVFSRARAYLTGELGLEPGPGLQALQRQILEHAPALAVPADGGRREPETTSSPLPRPLRPAAPELPFAGREGLLDMLKRNWAATAESRTVAVHILSGEAGIGKTRAAAELAAIVHGEGARVLYGGCDEGLGAPYQPFVEAVRGLLATLDLDQLRGQLGGFAPELSILLPELVGFGRPATADPESARLALFEAVTALLEIATAQRRTLLVIDDLQWAATGTLLLLRHLIRSQRALSLLIVVTFRSTEAHPGRPLAQFVADLQRDASVSYVALDGLDEQAVDTLVRAALAPGLAEPSSRLVAMVHAETAGNPFFVRELIAHLLDSDAFVRGQAAALPDRLAVPDRLRSLICQRVARLSDQAQRLVSIASVAGATNSAWLLRPLFASEDELLDAVDEAVAAGLLVETQLGDFSFAHTLVRHAVYDNLAVARRLRLHRQLGETLEAHGDAVAHAEALAHHFAQLAAHGEAEKAVAYALAAGHAATERYAYEDAATHFQRGLDILAHAAVASADRHVELLLALGRTRWTTGEPDDARRAFAQAADIARTTADAPNAAAAALGFSGPWFFEAGGASMRDTVRLLLQALTMLDERDSALRARLMGRLSAAYAYAGQPDVRHRDIATAALSMARRAADKHTLTDVLATTYWATWGPDDPDHHHRVACELVRLAAEVDDALLLAYGRGWVISHQLERGDLDAALRELHELRRLARMRNDRLVRWLLAALEGVFALNDGQLERAQALASEALGYWTDQPQLDAPGGSPAAPRLAPPLQVFGAQMIFVRREQGRLGELVGLVAAYAAEHVEVPAWRCALAHIHAQLGDREAALAALESVGDPTCLPRNGHWLLCMTFVASTAALIDDLGRCRQAYDMLLPYADICLVALAVMCEGSISRLLGVLATALGRYEQAEAHFERALRMNEAIHAPLWTAHTQHELARMLRLRGGPGDDARARALLAAAQATADELGLEALGQRVHASRCRP